MKTEKILFGIVLFLNSNISSQVPAIQWQKTFGGTKGEEAKSICNTEDGGYMVLGYADSEDGNVSHHKGPGSDVWLLQLDSLGNLKWNKCYGGTYEDYGSSIKKTFDGGFIFTGSTDSQDGDVTGYHGFGGHPDYWVVKIDSTGNIQWQKCLGGSSDDNGVDIIQTADSGYLVTGVATSYDGDVTGFHGNDEMWVVKLSKSGSKQWTRSLGGREYEWGNSCKQTKDGGYLIAGAASSTDGDVTGLHSEVFGIDAWVVKLNSLGQLQWQKCYGGLESENGRKIILSQDGGFFLLAQTSSSDGDVSGSFGLTDFWLVKADSVGNIEWQKCYGGNSDEDPTSFSTTSDGGIIITGAVIMDNGMVTGTHFNGKADWWVAKIDSAGNFQWGKALGGYGEEYPYSIIQTPDEGYLVAGYTTSTDGDVTFNHGGEDFWIVKLAPLGLSIPEVENSLMELNTFQNNDQLNLRFFSKHNQHAQLFIYHVNGKKVFEKSISINEGINYTSVNCTGFSRGMYFVRVDGEKGWESGKIIIE